MSEEQIQLLKEILKWIKFQNLPNLKKVLMETLNSPEKQLVYEFTDGKNSSRAVVKHLKGLSYSTSPGTISVYWNSWFRLGIVENVGKGRPCYQKIVSLPDVGIDLPKELKTANPEPVKENKMAED